MKFLVAFAVCIVACSAYVRRPIEKPKGKIELVHLDGVLLATQMNEFSEVLPLNDIVTLITTYVREDKEVLYHWNYVFSPQFKDSFGELQKAREFRDLLDFIEVSGVDVYTLLNLLNDALEIDRIVKEKDSDKDSKEADTDKKDSEEKDDHKKDSEEKEENYKIGDGMVGLVADFKAIMPYKEIYAMHDKKMLNECPYALFMNRMFSNQFATILQNLFHSNSYTKLVDVAVDNNIDVVSVRDLAHAMIAIDRYHKKN